MQNFTSAAKQIEPGQRNRAIEHENLSTTLPWANRAGADPSENEISRRKKPENGNLSKTETGREICGQSCSRSRIQRTGWATVRRFSLTRSSKKPRAEAKHKAIPNQNGEKLTAQMRFKNQFFYCNLNKISTEA
jgi:hypothetical protein